MAVGYCYNQDVSDIFSFIISLVIAMLLSSGQSSLPTAQADTGRKNDVSVLSASVLEYQSNNRGRMPTAADLSTANLEQVTSVTDQGDPSTTQAVFTAGKSCEGTTGARAYSVTIALEAGGTYCSGS